MSFWLAKSTVRLKWWRIKLWFMIIDIHVLHTKVQWIKDLTGSLHIIPTEKAGAGVALATTASDHATHGDGGGGCRGGGFGN
ncbi:unnamed protein product [Prunus armeniaca]